MKTLRYNIIAVVLAMMPLLVSCRQELCYDHFPTMNINFTWEQEWERDYGFHHLADWDKDYYGCDYDDMRPGIPEWINMISYFEDGRRADGFVSPEGKQLVVEPGETRSILLYNGDTEYIVFEDVASFNDARATATTRSRSYASLSALYKKYADARTTNPPDILYSAYLDKVPGIQNHEVSQIAPKMQPLVYTYLIDYQFETGIDQVAIARGAIGGMAESVYLRTGVTSEKTSIVLFDCDVKASGCQASVRSFGVPGFPDIYYGRTGASPKEYEYTLSLEVMLKNGKVLDFTFDVTDQLKTQPRGGVIKVGGLKIENQTAPPSAGGFIVDVSDWDEYDQIIDLPIGNQPKND